MKFCLPYIDRPISFWESLQRHYGRHIAEVYFPMGDHIIPSGRPVQRNPNIYAFLEKSKLPKTVLINPIVLSRPLEHLQDTIINELMLLNRNYGVQQATVNDLRLCHAIKARLPEYSICASVLMRINSPEQIAYLQVCTDSISLDTAILRDIGRIKAIREAYPGVIKLIVNEGCLPGCPFRVQHFFEMNSDLPHPESLCEKLLKAQPWLRLKSGWILPQHLHFYDGLYDMVKLAGRVTLQDPEKYMTVFRAYLERTHLPANEIGCGPAGLLKDIPITEEFFYTTLTCNKNCMACDICKAYYESHG